ncbi:MAG TPA: hypothetical protein H9811_02495 [Candidatus Gemmiger excrementigallinarum]|uniref:Uncharacterized protein n=1 Tax=Candidatus Gemmiger excrementigallinarum TaxID=2838609 RepID=A0A9D2EQK0_9FIRM|nr:hypothetical protein [Candidatus Gemmiger excrementigallinarum]
MIKMMAAPCTENTPHGALILLYSVYHAAHTFSIAGVAEKRAFFREIGVPYDGTVKMTQSKRLCFLFRIVE